MKYRVIFSFKQKQDLGKEVVSKKIFKNSKQSKVENFETYDVS